MQDLELHSVLQTRCFHSESRSQGEPHRIVAVGQSVNRLVRLPLVGLTLRLLHTPAHLSGWADLQSFLERGFSAFKQIKNADPFLEIISQREKKILKQIYAGDWVFP